MTVLKTVSMYLRAAKTEAEDAGESTDGMANSVSELRSEILALTGSKVDIQIDENTFKSTYQILKELSGVWEELSDISQANILEMVGGKRNSNVVAAILENFEIAEKSLTTSTEAAGSALAENEKYLDSIQGKIDQFKATFEDFSQNLIGSDFVKQVVYIGTVLLNIANIIVKIIDALGGLNTVLITVGLSVFALKFEAIVGFINKIRNGISLLSTAIGVFGLQVKETFAASQIAGMSKFKSALLGIRDGFKEVGTAASAAQVKCFWITAAVLVVYGLVKAFDYLSKSQERAYEAAEKAREEYDEETSKLDALNEELESSTERYDTLYKKQQSQKLTFVEQDELDKLKATNEQLELEIQNQKELQAIKAKDSNNSLSNAFNKQSYTSISMESALYDYNALKDANKELLDFYDNLEMNAEKYADEHNLSSKEYEKYYQGLIDNMDEYRQVLQQLDDLEKQFNPDRGATNKVVNYETYIDEVIQRYNYLNKLKAEGNKLSNEQSLQLQQIRDEILVPMMAELKTDYIDKYIGDDDTVGQWKDIYDSIGKALYGAEYFAQKLDELPDILKTKLKALGEQSLLTADNISELSKSYPQLNSWMQKSGYIAEDVANYYNALSQSVEESVDTIESTITTLNKLSQGFEQLDKIYKDIIDDNGFDISLIADNKDFKDQFSSLSSYTDFLSTIVKFPNDVKKCQEAFNNLTTEYIKHSGILSTLNDENNELIANYLKAMGVENATAIVDAELAYQKEKLKYATEEYADKTLDQIQAEYNVADASETAKLALAELWLQKLNLNTYKIDTSSDIDQIINMANAANAAASSIAALERAKSVISAVEKGTAAGFHMLDNGDYDKALQTIEDINNGTFNFNFQGIDASKFKSAVYSGSDKTIKEQSKQSKSAESAASKAASAAKEAFTNEYNAHKHKVQMELESENSYYDWLEKRSKEVFDSKIIDEGDYWKYQEEVFEGRRKLYKDYLSDVEHEISMRKNYDGESKNIVLLYEDLIKKVEQEIASARAKGLNDTDDYIQELQDKWQDYTNAIKDMREEIEEAAKDALDELIDYRVDMLKQEIEDEKDALDKKLDNLKEFYDKQKEMLQDKYDEEKYLEDQAEKRKSVSDIKGELAMLENDDSARAQKRKLELTEELTDAEKDLADFEKENALDKALDAIDEAYNSQEAQLQREMDALDEKLNDPNALFNQALEDIKNNSKNQLYYQMLMYNRQYGDGNDETVKKLWEDAYGALNNYEKLFGKLYKGVDLKNETGVKNEKGWDDEKVSGTKPKKKPKNQSKPKNDNKNTAPPLSSGSKVTIKKTATHFGSKSNGVKMASFVPGGSYTVYQTSGNQVLIGRNGVYTGWVKKSDIVGYASGTKHATAGLHELYERGAETLFVSGDGSKYRILNDDDKVLNAKATNFLYDFANSGGGILEQMLKNVFGGAGLDSIAPTVVSNEINMGDIIVQGSANERTVSEIRRAQRESVDFMLKEFTKLNK